MFLADNQTTEGENMLPKFLTRALLATLIALPLSPIAKAGPAEDAQAAFSKFFPAFVAHNQAEVAAMFAPVVNPIRIKEYALCVAVSKDHRGTAGNLSVCPAYSLDAQTKARVVEDDYFSVARRLPAAQRRGMTPRPFPHASHT